jgi:DNA-binding response OmpR family regulator
MDQTNRPARIMVVDDDRDTAAILVRYLESEGFDPIEANSGAECLRLAREKDVDVILLDLMMPDMDGFEICKMLKENPATAEIPVILITARDDIEARAESMSLGVGDFLAKPISRRQLAAAIRAQIEVVATERKTTATLSRIEGRGENSKN